MQKFKAFFVAAFSKLRAVWEYVPRKIKLLIAGLVLASVRAKFPGYIPDEITPELILGMFGGVITMHTITDIASMFATRSLLGPAVSTDVHVP